jgi:predicted HTH domain antitoxin
MRKVVVHYPDDLPAAVQLTDQELEQQLRLMAALKLFELGKLSSGKAAELAGMGRVQFFEACAQYGVSVYNATSDDLESELRADVNAARKART